MSKHIVPRMAGWFCVVLLVVLLSTDGPTAFAHVKNSAIAQSHGPVDYGTGSRPTQSETVPSKANTTVFVIMMENHNWADIAGNTSAPYINHVLLPQSSYTRQYYNPPRIHPSEPNYLWLEAGTNFGITLLLGDAVHATDLRDLFKNNQIT